MTSAVRDVSLNSIIASPLVHPKLRWRILKWLGADVHSSAIFSRVFFGGLNFSVGEGALINHGSFIDDSARVVIGESAFLAMNVSIITSSHKIGPAHQRAGELTSSPVTIGPGSWLGAGVTVLPGVTIGSGCVVLSGAVVTRDTKANSVYAGVPARFVRHLGDDVPSARSAPISRDA